MNFTSQRHKDVPVLKLPYPTSFTHLLVAGPRREMVERDGRTHRGFKLDGRVLRFRGVMEMNGNDKRSP